MAFWSHWWRGARSTPTNEAQEFFQLFDESKPRFFKKRRKKRAASVK
jgi:hypothetical protein